MICYTIYYVTNKRGDCQKKADSLRWICVPQCRKTYSFATLKEGKGESLDEGVESQVELSRHSL